MSLILCTVPLTDEQAARIRREAPNYELVYGKDKDLWAKKIAEAEIVVGWKSDFEETIAKPESPVKWIQVWSAGVDRLPHQTLSARNIYLTTTSGIHAYPISETVLAMMLTFTRNLHLHMRNQVHGTWQYIASVEEMHGKTAGIIGVGAIGEEIARLLQAFGMRVIGLRQSERPSEFVDEMVGLSKLEYILDESDYVVVTLPLTSSTRKMFGAEQFRMMKRSAMFINIGRGEVVDEQALILALQEGHIAGAGLDVFEQEPLPATSPLWKMDNVIITPHASGGSKYYNERAFEVFMDNLAAYLQTGAPRRNVVDYRKQY